MIVAAVGRHRDAGAASLGEVQLFEKLAYAAISVSARDGSTIGEVARFMDPVQDS
jgi:hypothetical protein